MIHTYIYIQYYVSVCVCGCGGIGICDGIILDNSRGIIEYGEIKPTVVGVMTHDMSPTTMGLQ